MKPKIVANKSITGDFKRRCPRFQLQAGEQKVLSQEDFILDETPAALRAERLSQRENEPNLLRAYGGIE